MLQLETEQITLPSDPNSHLPHTPIIVAAPDFVLFFFWSKCIYDFYKMPVWMDL